MVSARQKLRPAQQVIQKDNTMKARWTRNSIRLRITPGELNALQSGQAVTEELKLGPGGGWSVTLCPASAQTGLTFELGALRLTLAQPAVLDLARPETEGIYFQTPTDPALRYYIEKDFPCIHPRAAEAQEPVNETFQPPQDFAERKEE